MWKLPWWLSYSWDLKILGSIKENARRSKTHTHRLKFAGIPSRKTTKNVESTDQVWPCLTWFCETLQLFHMSPPCKACSQLAVASQDPPHRALWWHFGLPHGSGGDWHCMQRTQRDEPWIEWTVQNFQDVSISASISAYVTYIRWDLRGIAINSRGRSRKCSCSFHCRNSSSSQGQVLHERMQKLEAMSPPPLIILPVWSSNWNGQQFCSWRCVRHPSLSFPRVTILALVLVVQVCSDKWFQLRFPTIHHVKLCEAWAAKIQKALIYDMMLDARETCERHLLRCTVHCLRRCRPWSLSVLAEIANAYIAKEIHTTTIAVLQCYERQISTKCSFMFCL